MTKKGHGLLLIIFAQTCLIWNNLISGPKKLVKWHFPHSIVVTEYEFSTSIEK